MRATWYVLEDGSVVDPSECAPDEKGRLMHSGGVAVAMRGEVPHGRGVEVDENSTSGTTKPAAKTKDVKPAKSGGKGYETR